MARINNHINKRANYGAIIAYIWVMNRSDLIAHMAESYPQLQIKDAELEAKELRVRVDPDWYDYRIHP